MFENKLFIHKETGDIIKIAAAMISKSISDRENKVYYFKADDYDQFPEEITGEIGMSEFSRNYTLYDDVRPTDVNDDVIRLIESGVKVKHFQCKTTDGKDIVIKLLN